MKTDLWAKCGKWTQEREIEIEWNIYWPLPMVLQCHDDY